MDNIEQNIEKLEKELNIRLSDTYKSFLSNTKKPFEIGIGLEDLCYENNDVDDEDEIDFISIRAFYGNDKNGFYDLYKSNISFFGRVPKEFIIIAEDVVGNRICLGINGEYKDKIYYWDMEGEAADGEPAHYKNIDFISESLEIFLDRLFEDV